MKNNPEAGLDETGLGRSQDDGVSSLLARRMAALTVRRKCNTHACTVPQGVPCGHQDHRAVQEILDMLELPHELYFPSSQERETLFENLPQHVHFDMKDVNDVLTPESARRSRV